MKKIILASASPRRSQILEQIGLKFIKTIPEVDENGIINDNASDASSLAVSLACAKACSVAGKQEYKSKDIVIIGADTVVECGGRILGKPVDNKDAGLMLSALSNKTHSVITGLCLYSRDRSGNDNIYKGFEETKVTFCKLKASLVDAYIATGEPFDKAGAYGIQGMGAIFVRRLEGCYFNVVGLPVYLLTELLKNAGIEFSDYAVYNNIG